MSMNGEWRRSLSAWRSEVSTWVNRHSPEDILNVDIFYDARVVYGDRGLGTALLDQALTVGGASREFLTLLKLNACRFDSPAGYSIQLDSRSTRIRNATAPGRRPDARSASEPSGGAPHRAGRYSRPAGPGYAPWSSAVQQGRARGNDIARQAAVQVGAGPGGLCIQPVGRSAGVGVGPLYKSLDFQNGVEYSCSVYQRWSAWGESGMKKMGMP